MLVVNLSDNFFFIIYFCSGFALSTKDGFKIFDSSTGRLCYERGKLFFLTANGSCAIT